MSEILKSIRRSRRRPKRRIHARSLLISAAAVAAVAIFVALLLGGRALATSRPLCVRTVLVHGLDRLYENDVRTVATQATGHPILFYDLDALRDQLEQIPGVGSAVVSRRLPDLIEVSVTERVAVARTRVGRQRLLVDAEGSLFPPARELASDSGLPVLKGLSTPVGERELIPQDRAALKALEALMNVTGQRPPAGTIVDLTPKDRILLRPGPDAPALWLDRDAPERNLKNLFAWKDSVARLASDRAIDLRFPHRLTVVADGDRSTTR